MAIICICFVAINFQICISYSATPCTDLLLGDILGSHGDEYKDDCLLGCCAVHPDRNPLTFQNIWL
jgi:hypothetical protein